MRISRVQGFGVIENQGASGAEIGGEEGCIYIYMYTWGVGLSCTQSWDLKFL